MKKHRKVFRNLLIDLLCTGLALLVFALFHHVLPRQQQSLGIVIANPYQVDSAEDGKDAGFNLPDDAMLIASAGVSDSTTLSGRGESKTTAAETAKTV